MRFVDEITLMVKAGNGGNGAVAFLREKYRPKGGPAGGDGGRGGDVVLRASRNLTTLLDLRYRKRIEAPSGRPGQGKDRHGAKGESAIVPVPMGTTVFNAETGEQIGDLVDDEQELAVAKGGDGGRGNKRFATPTNRAPRRADPGDEGEALTIRMELKLLADVGIIGLPNVGKSTLISRYSRARPEVADYPFTTLVPNLGVVEIGPYASFVMADIPGLVRGAADGAGLGSRFLRHVQRTAILLHLVAPDETGQNDLLADFDDVMAELEAFDPELAERPTLVALNKMDLPDCRDQFEGLARRFAKRGIDIVPISAMANEGLGELKKRIAQALRERDEQSTDEAPIPDGVDDTTDLD